MRILDSINFPASRSWVGGRTLVLLCSLILLTSCAKKNPSRGQSSPAPTDGPTSQTSSNTPDNGYTPSSPQQGKGVPIDIPEALAAPKSRFQSRSDIVLPVDTYEMQAGDRISLDHIPSGKSIFSTELPNGFMVPDSPRKPIYFIEDRGFALGTLASESQNIGHRLMIRLVPRVLLAEQKMSFGPNPLSLLLDGATTVRSSSESIIVQDFPFFSLGTAAFTNLDTQRTSTYQGRMSWVAGSIVRGVKSELTVGTVGTLNR